MLLDPACGTGTFLYAVVDLIRRRFMEDGNAGMWPGYIANHLLPRVFGFELIMAPYAMAHFKLSLQLAGHDLSESVRADWAYDLDEGQRLGVYLTDALEGPHEWTGLPLFTQFLADETEAANRVKQDLPVLVVFGNPPYSGHSVNKGKWITQLLRDYRRLDDQPLGERNPKWLQDDYVKFFRFAQWRVARSGAGLVAFITNNGYLENPTFRGMRQQLIDTFTDIFILDLHGSSKRRERSPDETIDENVFDIRQGVAIGLFVKAPRRSGPTRVHHAHLWGTRESKYGWLAANDVRTTKWISVQPSSPFYLFTPQDDDLRAEYERGWKLTDMFPISSVGVVTGQDRKAIAPTWEETSGLASVANLDDSVVQPILYRPFDVRYIVYDKSVVTRPRINVMRHLVGGKNLGLVSARSNKSQDADHFFCSRFISEAKAGEATTQSTMFPLYIGPDATSSGPVQSHLGIDGSLAAPPGRRANLATTFVEAVSRNLAVDFVKNGKGDLVTTFGPEDIFHYAYAVFHSPRYRRRYADFLRFDYPRVPLTADLGRFRRLCKFGEELTQLHILERHMPAISSFPIRGDNRVELVRYEEHKSEPHIGCIWINRFQYFAGVPNHVWMFRIGGYQVCDRWLKDRKGRELTFEDLEHFQGMLAALDATQKLMAEIDDTISNWPVE